LWHVYVENAAIWERDESGALVITGYRNYTYDNFLPQRQGERMIEKAVMARELAVRLENSFERLREHPKVADILEREGAFDTVSRAVAYLKGFAARLESARDD
jgi:hypothetical protein